MIASLKGTISHIAGVHVTVDVQGVGYAVTCSAACIAGLELGMDAKIVISTVVREDEITLYGFEDDLEKHVFILLTTVQGVGPRTASEIISRIEKRELLRAIGAGDVFRLQAIKGVGRKLSERIVVELKDKVAQFALERPGLTSHVEQIKQAPLDEAMQALMALGFQRKDAEKAVHAALASGISKTSDSSVLVKEALRFV